MPALVRVFKRARARDQAQITVDPNGKTPTKITAQETWRVQYDGAVDQITAMGAAGLPTPGLFYTGLGTCVSRQPIRLAESPNSWDVQVQYETQAQVGTGNTWNVNIQKSSASREETATEDRLGLPLVNTVGELLPQLPNITFYDDVWNITWTTKVDPAWGDIEGKTNSDSVSFTICGISRSFTQGQMKCIKADFSSTKITNGVTGSTPTFTFTYDCTLSFQIRKPKWVWSAPNEGFYGYNDSDVLAEFREDDTNPQSMPKSSPTKMDLEGHKLAQGSVPLKLPDDAIGAAIPNGCRDYVAAGAFELEDQTAFSALFTGLND